MKQVVHRLWSMGRSLQISGLILGFIFVLFLGVWRVEVQAEHTPEHLGNTTGFFWSDTFGWISVNCSNDWDNSGALTVEENRCGAAGGDYRVEVSTLGRSGELTGFAWSPNFGLVCFGETCTGSTPDGTAPDAVFEFGIGENVALVTGWARVEAHQNEGAENQGGWIRLNGMAPGAIPVEIVARVVEDSPSESHLEFSGAGWQRNQNGSGVGWGVGFVDVDVSGEQVPRGVEPCPDRELVCSDGVDNDCDVSFTLTNQRDTNPLTGRDCQDYDCAGTPECSNGGSGGISSNESLDSNRRSAPWQCFDNRIDNDLDAFVWQGEVLVANPEGGVDCGDPDCAGATYIEPDGTVNRCRSAEVVPDEENLCDDGEDNDQDGGADCEDPDNECREFVACNPENLVDGHENCAVLGGCANQSDDPEGEDFCADADGDLVCDDVDNCLNFANPTQSDRNDNGIGDLCDAFLQTREGALYGRGFRSPAAAPVPNATFCLLSSGSITNFEGSRCSLSRDLQENVQEFRLRQYGDTLVLWSEALRARMDLNALRPPRGQELTDAEGNIDWRALGAATTGGQIFYHRGDVTVDAPIVWQNGTRLGTRTILIEGNVRFEEFSSYATPSDSLRELASVAWIVVDNPDTVGVIEGNITIASTVGGNSVADLVGAYVASGTISTGTRGPSDLQLKVRGLMTARSFTFARQYRPPEGSPQEGGAELIIYDGRATLNPPAGLTDFVKGLPVTRTVVPTQ